MRLQIILLSILVIIIGLVAFEIFNKDNPAPKKEKTTKITQNINIAPIKDVLQACTGLTSTQKTPDGKYKSTAFGCYIDDNGNRNDSDTPGCIAACGNIPGECDGLSEADCMYKMKWFVANADQYGCHNRLKVTNPANGKSIIAVVYDRGPHCDRVNQFGEILDMSYPAAAYLEVGDYQDVQVEETARDTPLGPTDGSEPTTGNTNTGTGGNFNSSQTFSLKLLPLPAANDSYIKNEVTAEVFGARSTGTSSPSANTGNTGPVNPNASCPGAGEVTCGTLANNCHCSASYQTNACGGTCDYCQPPADAAKFAIDINNPLDAPVYIPKISVGGEAHTLTCKGYDNQSGSREPGQIIQILSCSDDTTDQAIWMQFHHSKKEFPIVVDQTYKSGDAIGRSASFVSFNSGPHVHFQMGVGGACGFNGTEGCVEPTQYVQCN